MILYDDLTRRRGRYHFSARRGEKLRPMKLNVHISPIVIKRLKTLEKGGGNASQAAEHARKIISQTLEGICSPKQIGRLTKYGEARISNCIKFDLVRGYRLTAVIRKGQISFLFVGSHDECDHWAKNNAGLESVGDFKVSAAFPAFGEQTVEKLPWREPGQEDEGDADDYDRLLLRDLTDGDLRKIFCGLCGGRPSSAPGKPGESQEAHAGPDAMECGKWT
jgi:hypothetical protein